MKSPVRVIRDNERKKRLYEMDIAYRDLFNSPNGEKVLEDLILNFLPDKLSTDCPHTTAVRIGESNPIRYIQRRIHNGMDGKSA